MLLIQYLAFAALFPLYLSGITLVLRGFFSPEKYLQEIREWKKTSWQSRFDVQRYFACAVIFFIAAVYARFSILWLISGIICLVGAVAKLLAIKYPRIFFPPAPQKELSPNRVLIMLAGWVLFRLLTYGLWCYAWKHLF
jgi:uncharacterized membrane protein HdeD (DUF308 family)